MREAVREQRRCAATCLLAAVWHGCLSFAVGPEGPIKGVGVPVPAVGPGGLLVERVDDDQPGRDGFRGQGGHAESISEQARASPALCSRVSTASGAIQTMATG